MLSVIKAVFLDGDQTLWDFEKLMRRAMVATLGELTTLRPGPATEQLDVDSLVADREAVTDELRGRETTSSDYASPRSVAPWHVCDCLTTVWPTT